jgi:replicative superfamily II helicase
MKEFQPNHAFNSTILEIKGIGLMYAGYYLSQHKQKYNKKKHLPFVFGIMVAIQRYLNNCKNLDGKNIMNPNERITMSTTICSDLKKWLDHLITLYPYNGFAIYDYAPELLTYTEYDKAIPSTGIKPRKHQIDLMSGVRENLDVGFFGIYNPMLASGKTSLIGGLGSFIGQIRQSNPEKYGDMTCIFACNAIPVRNQAANICYNGGIKFAIAGHDQRTGSYRIVNHNSCKYENDRFVIIASPEIAAEILSDPSNGNTSKKYIVYLDEPTMGADKCESDSLKKNMNLLTEISDKVILSSATFPDPELIPDITNFFINKYPTAKILTIYSDEIQIGCDLETFDGQLVVPHLGIKNSTELKYVIGVIRKCPFLGRVYTPHVVKTLYVAMSELKIPDIPNIAELFSNVDNMSSNKVRQIAMNMLDILANQDDKTIETVCSSNIMTEKETIVVDDDDEPKKPEKEDTGFVWVSEKTDDANYDNGTDPIDFKKLGTTQAWRMQNPTVIASSNPVEFAREMFADFVKDIYNAPLGSDTISTYKNTKNIITKYQRDKLAFDKQKLSIEKNTDNEDLLSQKLQDFDELAPKLKFPDFGHVNTLPHTRKYAKSHASKLVGRYVRTPIVLEELPLDIIEVPDDLLTLLFAGIGVCVSNHPDVDETYSRIVLELASEGKLAFIIVDESFAHGTNYPINRVIFTDEYADDHDIFNIMQMLGRAGRVGRSWVAKGIVSGKLARRIITFTRNMQEAEIQATNMTNCFNNILKTKEVRQRHKLEELLKKYMPKTEVVSVVKQQTEHATGLSFKKNRKDVPLTDNQIAVQLKREEGQQLLQEIDLKKTTYVAKTAQKLDHPAETLPRTGKVSEFVDDYSKKQDSVTQSWRRPERTSHFVDPAPTERKNTFVDRGNTFVDRGNTFVNKGPTKINGRMNNEKVDDSTSWRRETTKPPIEKEYKYIPPYMRNKSGQNEDVKTTQKPTSTSNTDKSMSWRRQ